MQKVVDAGNASDPKVFARNRLAIIVEDGNPKAIARPCGSRQPDIVLVLCAPEVPCGKFAAAALAKAGVTAKPASLEENVKAVVAKVTLGEADAGIVLCHGRQGRRRQGRPASTSPSADDAALEAVYPIAVTDDASQPRRWRQRVDHARAVATQGRRCWNDSASCCHERRGGRRWRSSRWPSLAVAPLRRCPLVGLLWRAPWSRCGDDLSSPAVAHRAAPVARVLAVGDGDSRSRWAAAGLGAGPRARSRAGGWCGPLCSCRWCCRPSSVASRCCWRSGGGGSSVSTSTAGSACSSRSPPRARSLAETFVAMPFLVITVEAAFRAVDRRYEEAARTLGRRAVDSVPPRHAAACMARRWPRRGAGVGAGARRVRRHDHVRRQHPGRTQTMPLRSTCCSSPAVWTSPSPSASCCSPCRVAVLVGLRDRWIGAL